MIFTTTFFLKYGV